MRSAEAMGAVVGRDAANQGVDVLLAPGLNTKRSSLCGRSFEYYSEDPYLSGKLAAGFIRGAQKPVYALGDDPVVNAVADVVSAA